MDRSLPAANDILPALRAATGPMHQRLETLVDIGECVNDRARYRRLLQNFLGFYRPLEARLAVIPGWPEGEAALSGRRKTPWLEEDLGNLSLSAAEIDALPDCQRLPPTTNLAQGFGCLYVLEGATLGGRQITAMMRQSPVPAAARRFFGSYGADTGARWREFVAALERQAAAGSHADRGDIVQAAQETFTCLHDWIYDRVASQ